MADRGYGSEAHLRRYLAEHRAVLDAGVAEAIGVAPADVEWLDFIPTANGDREDTGVEFLGYAEHADVRDAWRQVWPTTGRQPSWDAIATAANQCVLVEAKENAPEFCSPGSTASPESRKQIVRAPNATKKPRSGGARDGRLSSEALALWNIAKGSPLVGPSDISPIDYPGSML